MKNEDLIPVKKRFSKIEAFDEHIHLKSLHDAWLVVREKIDGSNLQIKREGDRLTAGSRDYVLTETNRLNKAYDIVQSLDASLFEEGYIYFAEWITPYRLNYKEDFFTLRLLTVAEDDGSDHLSYVNPTRFEEMRSKTKLPAAPLFYQGPFISMEHLESFVGKTEMVQPIGDEAAEFVKGEGIVIMAHDMKSKELMKEKNGKNKMYKMVNHSFKERKLIPKKDDSHIHPLTHFLAEVTTEARIHKKYLDKVVEEVYPSPLTKKDIATVMKTLPVIIQSDIREECGEELNKLLRELVEKEKEFIKESIHEEHAESVDKKYEKLISKFITDKVLKFVMKEIEKGRC